MPNTEQGQPTSNPGFAMMGFLAAAIAILGMLGVMATYVTPLPYKRAMAREAAMDTLLAEGGGQAVYTRLSAQLADSAVALQPGPNLAERVAAERKAMRTRLEAESAGAAARLRVMIAVVTVITVLFGAVAMGVGRRR